MRYFLNGAIGSAISFLSLFSLPSYAVDLGDFNVVVFEDFDTNSDVEGSTFVGGNLVGSSATFGSELSPGEDGLVVGGNISGGPKNVNNGTNVIVGGEVNATINLNGGGNLIQDPTISGDQLEAEFLELSQFLSTLTPTGTVQLPSGQPGPAIFNSGGGDLVVFEIDADDISGNLIQQIELIVQGSETVLINVSGETVDDILGNFVGDIIQDAVQQNVVWNFYQATILTLDRPFYGSILAPLADLQTNHIIEGTVIANNFTTRSEVHSPIFKGDLPSSEIPWETDCGAIGIVLALSGFGYRRFAKNKAEKA